MKRKILSGIIGVGLATCAFGQGLLISNAGNSGGPTATSGGQVFNADNSLFNGNSFNIGVTVSFGTSAGSLTPYGTYYPGSASNAGYNPYTGYSTGQFAVGPGTTVNPPGGVAGGTIFVELQMWDYDSPLKTGTFTSYAAALAGLDPVGTAIFSTPLYNPSAVPPQPVPNLTGMPSIVLAAQVVPEPATFALAGLGIASLLAFRRRK